MTATPETTTIEHLDFNVEISCERSNGCDKPAAWRTVDNRTCECKSVWLLCDTCKNQVVAIFNKAATDKCKMICHSCASSEPLQLVRVTRL